MPRYSKATPSVVGIEGYGMDFGFPCKASEAARSALGIRLFSGESNTVFGANRPKPPRAMYMPSKQTSFLDKDKPVDGVNVRIVKAGKPIVSPGGGRVAVKFHDAYWIWDRPDDVKTKIEPVPGYASLGIIPYTNSIGTYFTCYKCSSVFFKDLNATVKSPLRAIAKTAENTVSTYVETPMIGAAPAGWTIY